MRADFYDENDQQHLQTGAINMNNSESHIAAEPNTKPNSTPTPGDIPSPKRGAFPTPKAEIESAKPYIPDTPQTVDHLPTVSNLPINDEVRGE